LWTQYGRPPSATLLTTGRLLMGPSPCTSAEKASTTAASSIPGRSRRSCNHSTASDSSSRRR
ncbi:unnamed protein product, partial [Polarella glacialis]